MLTFLAVLCLCASFAAAVWSVSQSTENFLTMSSYCARIVEEYKVPKHVNPAETVTKKVNVKNEGGVDILVRVSVKKMFGRRQEDGSFEEDPSLDPDMIQITFNNQYWKQSMDGWFYYRFFRKFPFLPFNMFISVLKYWYQIKAVYANE